MCLRIKAENLVRLGRTEAATKVLTQLQQKVQNFYGKRELPILATFFVLTAFNNLDAPKKPALEEIALLKKALAIYEQTWKSTTKNPYQGFAHYVLGRVHEKAGDFVAALKSYQDAEKVYDAVLHHKAIHDMSLLYSAAGRLASRLKNDTLARAYLTKHSQPLVPSIPPAQKSLCNLLVRPPSPDFKRLRNIQHLIIIQRLLLLCGGGLRDFKRLFKM